MTLLQFLPPEVVRRAYERHSGRNANVERIELCFADMKVPVENEPQRFGLIGAGPDSHWAHK